MIDFFLKYVGGYDLFEYERARSYYIYKILFIIAAVSLLVFSEYSDLSFCAALICILLVFIFAKNIFINKSSNVCADCALGILTVSVLYFLDEYYLIAFYIFSVFGFDLILRSLYSFFDKKIHRQDILNVLRYRFISQKEEGTISKGDVIVLSCEERAPCDGNVIGGEAVVKNLLFYDSDERTLKRGEKIYTEDILLSGDIKVFATRSSENSTYHMFLDNISASFNKYALVCGNFVYWRLIVIVATITLYFTLRSDISKVILWLSLSGHSIFLCGSLLFYAAVYFTVAARKGIFFESVKKDVFDFFDIPENNVIIKAKRLFDTVFYSVIGIYTVSFVASFFLKTILSFFCGILLSMIMIAISVIILYNSNKNNNSKGIKQDEET